MYTESLPTVSEIREMKDGDYACRVNGKESSGYRAGMGGENGRVYQAIMVEVAKGNYTPYIAPPAPDPNLIALQATDKGMARVAEDLIDTLKSIGVITDNDLPSSVVDKMNNRKSLRAKF